MVLTAGIAVRDGTAGLHGLLRLTSSARAETARGISFDIPSQPLVAALDAYGASSRTQVLYEAALAAGRRSSTIKGLYTPDAALRQLLAGTGLDFDYTAEHAITLVPAKAPDPRARAEAERHQYIARFDHFLGGVQAGIIAALCRYPEARPGDFEVAMRFWVTGAGAIANPVLLASTGTPTRDRAIASILSRLSFSEPPPPEMPQPITMMLTNKASSRDRDICADAGKG